MDPVRNSGRRSNIYMIRRNLLSLAKKGNGAMASASYF